MTYIFRHILYCLQRIVLNKKEEWSNIFNDKMRENMMKSPDETDGQSGLSTRVCSHKSIIHTTTFNVYNIKHADISSERTPRDNIAQSNV